MVDRLTKLVLSVCLIILIGLVYIPVQGVFIIVSLGFILIPPALVFASIFFEGTAVILKRLQDLLASGDEFFVISISGESITLEPQFK